MRRLGRIAGGLALSFGAMALVARTGAQSAFPPGFVDPAPILAAAATEIGEANLRCVTFSGTGYGGAVGQAFESAVNVDWPRIDALANYKRTIDFERRTIVEEFDRKPGLNPASWKYGLGWHDGTPVQKQLHQTFVVSGDHGWHMDGVGAPPVAMAPDDVERGQLEIWMNPHGFLKAARLPGANPKAVWRWELGEMGRDGPTTIPEKVHVVSITLGRYRLDATINPRNQIQRIHTMVAEPALGDFNYEHESTDQRTFGSVKWPVAWHSHQGWDDNFGFDTIGDDDFLPNHADAESRRGHHRTGARPGGADVGVPAGDGGRRDGLPDSGTRRIRGLAALPLTSARLLVYLVATRTVRRWGGPHPPDSGASSSSGISRVRRAPCRSRPHAGGWRHVRDGARQRRLRDDYVFLDVDGTRGTRWAQQPLSASSRRAAHHARAGGRIADSTSSGLRAGVRSSFTTWV